ncbi:MAG: radical SAM protein [Thermoprotei archaeon]
MQQFEYDNKMIIPFSVSWEITSRCNLNCAYCHHFFEKYKEITFQQALLLIQNLIKNDIFELTITGGEPLLRKDLLNIMSYAIDHGLGINLVTNGTLITNEIARKLSKYDIYVTISLDGSSSQINDALRGLGTFKKIIKACLMLREAGVRFHLLATICYKNIADINRLAKLSNDLGAHILTINTVLPIKGRIKYSLAPFDFYFLLNQVIRIRKDGYAISVDEHMRPFLSILTGSKLGTCPAAKYTCAITSNGKIKPCQALSIISKNNLFEKSFSEIWINDINLNKFRKMRSPRTCRLCKCYELCGGGCRASSFAKYGCLSYPDPRCWIFYNSTIKREK